MTIEFPVFLVARLPRPVLVGDGILDRRLPTRLANVDAEVVFTADQSPNAVLDSDDATALRREDDSDAGASLTSLWDDTTPLAEEAPATTEVGPYGPDRDAPSTSVRRAVFRIARPDPHATTTRDGVPDNPATVTVVSTRADLERWRTVFSDWVEAYTDQDLDHLHPRLDAWIEGGGVATFDASGVRRPVGNRLRIMQRDEIPASPAVVAHA